MPVGGPRRLDLTGAVTIIAVLAIVALAGCATTPARRDSPQPVVPSGLYVDWDHHDWCVDRYVLATLSDLRRRTEPSMAAPRLVYQDAVTYQAAWDSVSLVAFMARDSAEQQARRRDGAQAHLGARRIILRALRSVAGLDDRQAESGLIDPGSERALTEAMVALIAATGTDPSNPAAWRDLAYFCGVVGDRPRQQRALAACLAALDQAAPALADSDDGRRLRRDVLLDLAWLARDLGQPAVTLAYLDHVVPWLDAAGPELEERLYEARLLRGLALADQGEWLAAVAEARDLPHLRVTTRSLAGGSARDHLRWSLTAPHFMTLGLDRSAWPRQASDFGRRWIKALAGAPAGESAHVLWLLGPPPTHLELPARLAARFWQDLGHLHAAAGQRTEASHCYRWAALYRPYTMFFPLQARTGRPRGSSPVYYVGYDRFFLCGDRQAYERDTDGLMVDRSRGAPDGD